MMPMLLFLIVKELLPISFFPIVSMIVEFRIGVDERVVRLQDRFIVVECKINIAVGLINYIIKRSVDKSIYRRIVINIIE